MKVNCIIVEDEPVSQDVLVKYVGDTPQLRLVCVCNNAFEAKDALIENPVQLMFLDINMPKLSGMSFLKSLTDPPLVIFTTAYSEYALEGYEVDAVDYLLKPFSFDRFMKAVNKAIDRLMNKETEQIAEKFILLNADKKIHKIDVDEISYLEAVGDYVKVHMANSSLLVHSTLHALADQLPAESFFQVHKSYVICTGKISFIEGNTVNLYGTELPIGMKYKDAFLEFLKK